MKTVLGFMTIVFGLLVAGFWMVKVIPAIKAMRKEKRNSKSEQYDPLNGRICATCKCYGDRWYMERCKSCGSNLRNWEPVEK